MTNGKQAELAGMFTPIWDINTFYFIKPLSRGGRGAPAGSVYPNMGYKHFYFIKPLSRGGRHMRTLKPHEKTEKGREVFYDWSWHRKQINQPKTRS